MRRARRSPQFPALESAPAPSEMPLRGPWLLLARLASAAMIAAALLLFVAGTVEAITQLDVVCARPCVAGQITAAQLDALHQFGLSLGAYIGLDIAFTLFTSLVWFGAAAIVLWHRSNTLFLLLLATQLITQGAVSAADVLTMGHTLWAGPARLLDIVNAVLFCFFLALFPNGRFVPRWIGGVVILASAVSFTQLFLGLPGAITVTFPITISVLIVAQIYRYFAVSTSLQRQQTKWVILGISIAVLVNIIFIIPPLFAPGLVAPGSFYTVASARITSLALTLAPIGFVFALLRYRLYAIDIIINRALVYGTLTVTLALVYFALVLGAQRVASAALNTDASTPAIVVSTLVIAALFRPLRARIQRIIDRRFYRRKYDAARTLAQFSATLRGELDLNSLTEHLLAVVEETMEPAQVSLWLRNPPHQAAFVGRRLNRNATDLIE